MTKSNSLWMQLKGLAAALIAVAVLASCVKAQKQNPFGKDGGPATKTTFRVRSNGGNGSERDAVSDLNLQGYDANLIRTGDVELIKAFDTQVNSKDAPFPIERSYVMKICGLQDMREGTLLGQRFNVYSEVPVSTRDTIVGKNGIPQANNIIESNSCIYFSAVIPYDHFGSSVNLAVNFFLVSTTGIPTYIHKTVLFNPWDGYRGGNAEFFDYTRTGIVPDLKNNTPWATGYEQVQQALVGKFIPITKQLQIGSVAVQVVDQTKFMDDNAIGDALSQEIKDNKAKRAAMSGGKTLETFDAMLTVQLKDLMVDVKTSLGQSRKETLDQGHYRIKAVLVASDSDYNGYYILSSPMIVSDERNWKQDQMGVFAAVPLSIVMRPTYGNLKLILHVTPVDVPGLKPFDGAYDLGAFNQLAGSKSPLRDPGVYHLDDNGTLAFNADDYLSKANNIKAWKDGFPEMGVDESTLETGFHHFNFTPPEIKFSRIMSGDTATDRTIEYTISTCLTDTHNYIRPDAGLKFYIETQDRGHSYYIHRQTDTNGCLNWVGMVSHKVYQREQLIHEVSTLRYDGKDADQPTYKLEYYLNPWDEKFGTFGRNMSQLTPEYLTEVAESQKRAPATRILITEFHYDTTGFRYVIDKFMNMTVKKTVLMQIRPTVLKYNSILSGRSGTMDLRDGIYLMKVAMQKDYLDPAARGRSIVPDGKGSFKVLSTEKDVEKKQFLTIKEMLIRVMGGKIVTPIEFDIKDLRTLRIRSQIFMQIETIDEMLLRVAVYHAQRVRCLKDQSNPNCINLMRSVGPLPDYTSTMIELDKTKEEIAKANDDAKKGVDDQAERDMLVTLEKNQKELLDKLAGLMANMDADTLKSIFDHHDLMVKMQQNAESADGNTLYDNTNALIEQLKASIQSNNADQFNKNRTDYVTDQGATCREIMEKLKKSTNKDDQAKAHLYDPDAKTPKGPNDDGALCFKPVPPEQLFYEPATNPYMADAYVKTLFGDEYSLYMKNIMPDDLTAPLVPDFDFNLLSNQGDELKDGPNVSGLPRRTFIGPVTFVLNGNGSAMRPTDALDEAHCDNTCAQLPVVNDLIAHSEEMQRPDVQAAINQAIANGQKVYDFKTSPNTAYEDNPYYGSVKHFYMKQVEDLIPMEHGLNTEYLEEMKAFSQLGNLADQMMLQYTSFAAQPVPAVSLDHVCYANWKSQIEGIYQKWRDNTNLNFDVPPLPESCYRQSKRNLGKDSLLHAMSNAPAGKITLELAQKDNLLKWNLPDVTEAQMKAFAKNGLLAPDSSIMNFDVKVNILHRFCYLTRRELMRNNSLTGKGSYKGILASRIASSGIYGTPNANIELLHEIGSLYDRLDGVENNCHKFVDEFAREVRTLGVNDPKKMKSAIQSRMGQLPLAVERKIRVVDTSGRYIYKDGKTVNYSVSTSFGLNNSMSVAKGNKYDPFETVDKLVSLGDQTRSGVFSSLLGATFGMMNFAWSTNESLAQTNGTSVSEGATLATQISTLDIELGKWEKCVVVHMDPKFYKDSMIYMTSSQDSFGANDPLLYNPDEDIASLGHLLCSGDEDSVDDLKPGMNEKIRVREHYYYLTQIFNEGDMQDPQSLSNHPWMLTLRGARDFGMFQQALKVPEDNRVNWSSGFSLMKDDITSLVTGFTTPRYDQPDALLVAQSKEINQSLSLLSAAFMRALPTFPGMYTFSDNGDDEVTDWTADDVSQ